MISLISSWKHEIEALCKSHGVRRLELFGSATTGAFDSARSDLAFIVNPGVYERGARSGTSHFVSNSKVLSNDRWM